MGREKITNPNCDHNFIQRECIHPLTKEILARWKFCPKCASEIERQVKGEF